MDSSKNAIKAIDTHVHMIAIKRYPYKWPRPVEEAAIYGDFLPRDYEKERSKTGIQYSILVEAFESVEETEWFLQMERENEFIKGVVGYADVTADDFKQQLARLRKLGQLCGLRKILDFSEDGWLVRDDVIRGMKVMAEEGVTFDLLVKSRAQFESAKKFLKLVPGHLKVVVDHLGKPDAQKGASEQWYEDVEEFASHENVYCKLSGMVTEADWENWRPRDFERHVSHVIKCFGADRLMFGSDWPVCKLAHVDLDGVYELLMSLLHMLSAEDKEKIFYSNAVRFYNLRV